MSTPHDLIRAIVDEDFVAAKEITNNLVFAAVSDELEVAKMEVAANLFDNCEDCGEVSEGQMSANRYGGGKSFDWKKPHPSNGKDYDKDGKIEPPKDEVHGSHINAAVKAGKLSPSAASKTKNKGKYR
jgi:hypothetical protein